MTYKSALAGLPHGGGKSVILLSPGQPKTEAMMRAFAKAVARLGGRYIVGEDIGTSPEDMAIIQAEGPYALGAPEEAGGSGDCSPMTAHGCFIGAQTAAKQRFGVASLEGLRVGVQGLGKVGGALCKMLHDSGAILVVSDVDDRRADRMVREYGAVKVQTSEIHSQEMDIFAPCAFGAVLNDNTIPELRAGAVAGAANNQLASPGHGEILRQRGVLFAPDYVVNAGGVIQLAFERLGGGLQEAKRRTEDIAVTLSEVFRLADAEGIPTNLAADRMAAARIDQASAGLSIG
jgi:leucine dehydrogenase